MLAEEIIIAPVVTEKSNDELQEGRYTFKVNKKATKVQIAQAVEKLFNVKVLKVNTMHVNGKTKRVGYHVGKTSDWKKAIVTIDTNPSDVSYLGKGGKEVKASKKYKDSIDEFMGAYKNQLKVTICTFSIFYTNFSIQTYSSSLYQILKLHILSLLINF